VTAPTDYTAELRPQLLAIMRAHPDHPDWTVEQLRSHGNIPFWQPVRTALIVLTEQGHLLINVHSTGPKYTYSLADQPNPPMGMPPAPSPDGLPPAPR
jgi:hypothetical protein